MHDKLVDKNETEVMGASPFATTVAAAAIARIRARGESIAAIARLTETTVSDVRAYLKFAAARGAQNTVVESSSEALGLCASEAANAGDGDTESVGLRA
jgi:sirohydrochlorin ferrochelatase